EEASVVATVGKKVVLSPQQKKRRKLIKGVMVTKGSEAVGMEKGKDTMAVILVAESQERPIAKKEG
ncbi:hypothetical protein Dimus_005358, partial [Dionaea muscipula]